MTAVVNRISSILVGQSAVPSSDRVFGPQQSSAGILGEQGEFNVFEALSTSLSLASASQTLFGADEQAEAFLQNARQKKRALLLEAQEFELEAKREETRGKQAANEITDSLIQTLAAQRVSFAANGVDISFGTPRSVARSTRKLAELQLSTTREDALARAISRRRQASALREEGFATLRQGEAEARNVRREGRVRSLGTVAELAERRARRG